MPPTMSPTQRLDSVASALALNILINDELGLGGSRVR